MREIKKVSPIDFISEFFTHWITAMSGPLIVPLTIIGCFVPSENLRIILILTAIICWFFACYILWKKERIKVIEISKEIEIRSSGLAKLIHQSAALFDQCRAGDEIHSLHLEIQKWVDNLNGFINANWGEDFSASLTVYKGSVPNGPFVTHNHQQMAYEIERRQDWINFMLLKNSSENRLFKH